jgi:nucleoside-diphosphate-sugar epimerase
VAANDGRVVSNFVVQALQGEPLTIYGDGSQTRSFCFVDDLIEGLVRLGTLESAPDGPINLGNEREVTIAEIADLVLAMTGSSSGVERLPLPQDDPVRRRPDTTRGREILGWEASVPLEVGLPSTIEYFRSVL